MLTRSVENLCPHPNDQTALSTQTSTVQEAVHMFKRFVLLLDFVVQPQHTAVTQLVTVRLLWCGASNVIYKVKIRINSIASHAQSILQFTVVLSQILVRAVHGRQDGDAGDVLRGGDGAAGAQPAHRLWATANPWAAPSQNESVQVLDVSFGGCPFWFPTTRGGRRPREAAAVAAPW